MSELTPRQAAHRRMILDRIDQVVRPFLGQELRLGRQALYASMRDVVQTELDEAWRLRMTPVPFRAIVRPDPTDDGSAIVTVEPDLMWLEYAFTFPDGLTLER